ncbi:hypothetical protein [Brucella pseudintermedia]|uniref:hypothetical protein n=1 Tax=Brucella pseudintermedia TaxID=370111 RepID=UPI00124CA5E7|nr:hypothetical protein [Brucella pseudintermedia]
MSRFESDEAISLQLSRAAKVAVALMTSTALGACQSAPKSSFDNPMFSNETRALEKQLDAEAAAVGTAQAVMSMPAAWDPTGAASLVTTPAGLAMREAQRRQADARMDAQIAKDQAVFYRKYGLNPDGSTTGRKGPLSVD